MEEFSEQIVSNTEKSQFKAQLQSYLMTTRVHFSTSTAPKNGPAMSLAVQHLLHEVVQLVHLKGVDKDHLFDWHLSLLTD